MLAQCAFTPIDMDSTFTLLFRSAVKMGANTAVSISLASSFGLIIRFSISILMSLPFISLLLGHHESPPM